MTKIHTSSSMKKKEVHSSSSSSRPRIFIRNPISGTPTLKELKLSMEKHYAAKTLQRVFKRFTGKKYIDSVSKVLSGMKSLSVSND